MNRTILIGAVACIGSIAQADPAEIILSEQPFTSLPWAHGDYYTTTLTLDGCNLTKTTVEYDGDDVAGDSHRIDMDLGQIDPARLDVFIGDVNLWGRDGYEVTCTDISGSDCVIPKRPGESIKIAESVGEDAYVAAVRDLITSCQ